LDPRRASFRSATIYDFPDQELRSPERGGAKLNEVEMGNRSKLFAPFQNICERFGRYDDVIDFKRMPVRSIFSKS
jgi:hypothetical protein